MRTAIIIGAVVILLIIGVSMARAKSESFFAKAAKRFGLREGLLKAVAHVESNFNAQAQGESGELGMFQMKRAAFMDAVKFAGLKATYPDSLLDPEQSAMLAAAYLAWLRTQGFKSDFDMLRAYNQGPTGARQGRGGEYAARVLETERRYYA